MAARPRSPFAIPLVALSATLVVLVAAIVMVAVVRSAGDRRAGADAAAGAVGAAGATPTGLVDGCVVGTWRVTSHRERVPIPNVGDVDLTGAGARVRLDADGTGVIEYGDGTTYRGTARGSTIAVTLAGSVNFDYRTADGVFSFANLGPDGTVTVRVDGEVVGTEELAGSDDPARYACTASKLTEFTDAYQVELSRQD